MVIYKCTLQLTSAKVHFLSEILLAGFRHFYQNFDRHKDLSDGYQTSQYSIQSYKQYLNRNV